MGLFKRKPKACGVCGMRGYHDNNVHRVEARKLARDVKDLRRELEDDTLEREAPDIARQCDFDLVEYLMKLEDMVQPLGFTDADIEEMILTS